MSDLGFLKKQGATYEFYYPEHHLVVRGAYVEWVLEAAAELIAQTERMRADGQLEELKVLEEMGEAEPIELEAAAFDTDQRFEVVPQCVVTMGALDYRWVAPEGRDPNDTSFPVKRVHDMSKTRNNTFLKNVDGVDTTKA